ncbi:hypothetical protein R1sor_014070 [Riccia sorocarpa]|uniref:Uncharacterized protein n=1 Tax=Riccia sorocarpa TaxID=122646 RepID=A0ABD3HCI5_9MARC
METELAALHLQGTWELVDLLEAQFQSPSVDSLDLHNSYPEIRRVLTYSEGSNPKYALNPDTPSQTFDVPAAIWELFKQNPPEALPPPKTPSSQKDFYTGTGDVEEAEPTFLECNACLLDPNFQDLLSEVEKVWRELEVSMSDESQLAQAVIRRLKAANSAGPSNGK